MLNELRKYSVGAMIGMCGTYLYRVELYIYPIIICIMLIILMIVDVIDFGRKRK
jgi:hypothetical protein|tara:strand:- start:18237 stop:18398 length:162 start_codon:yes stop_codon:yes gene_type:complete